MGLKAYDLVWLEGKSAAWRYPCEIEELSAFAPAVEEQPFDRFYKRPAATTSTSSSAMLASTTSTSPAPVAPAPTPAPPTPQYTGEPSAVPGKRIIYVTMPAGRTAVPVRETPREPLREMPKEPVRPAPAATPASAYASPVIEEYSSQLPSLEEQLVEFSPRASLLGSARRRNARILRLLAISACILALLVAGIFIGLSLNKENIGIRQQKTIAVNTPVKVSEQPKPIVQPTQQQLPPATNTIPQIVTQASTTVPPANVPPHVTTQKEKPAAPKKKGVLPPVTKDSPVVAPPIQHREAIHRADIVETKPDISADKDAVRTALASQVTVGSNGYTVGNFGGINDLQLTVTNRSIYPLDLVVVEIQYILASKKIYKTENLYFRGIGAGSALMQEAPKSSRGIKVQYKILTINSKEGGLTYSGI